MSVRLPDDDVVARLRANAPGYPDAGPDAGRTLAAARRALLRRRRRRALAGVAAVLAAVAGLTAAGPIELPGIGAIPVPGGRDTGALPNQGDPPVYPRQRMLDDAANLDLRVLPAIEDLGLTTYLDDRAALGRRACRGLTWSRGAYRDRDPGCSNPGDPESPFDADSEAAFLRVSDAIERSGVNVYRIEKGRWHDSGWGPVTSFRLGDDSWRWNWYYSYIPDTPVDAPTELRTDTRLGVRREVHVTGNWWFTVEPDD
jgi:hypothetical protein